MTGDVMQHLARANVNATAHAAEALCRPPLPVCPCALQRHHRSTRQIFAGWRLVCHRSALLRMALGRLQERTLSAAFMAWKYVAAMIHKRRSLLNVSNATLWLIAAERVFLCGSFECVACLRVY